MARSLVRLQYLPEVEVESRENRVTAENPGGVHPLRGLTRPVDDGEIIDGIQQPAKPCATGHVLFHFLLEVGKAV